ncbi:MAG TPA: HAMP domain-containing sensor histidine kinase [Longimicrobiales bacterium]|nr:HAMP domain-containing sensor histidine kinase [Longimicrobiales bacterium]
MTRTRGERRRVAGIRTQFLLVLVFGALLPLLGVTAWIALSARISAERLLRQRLEQQLAQTARTIGHRWTDLRPVWLELAESETVVAAVDSPHASARPAPVSLDVPASASAAAGIPMFVLDADSNVAGTFVVHAADRAATGNIEPMLPVRLPIHDATGRRAGTLVVNVPLRTLLPSSYGSEGTVGVVPALFDEDGTPLVQTVIDPPLFARHRFEWRGEEWVTAQRSLHEPAMRLALAAPTAPHAQPFAAAARNGVLGLLVVLGVSVILTTLLARRITVPVRNVSRAAEDVAAGRLDLDIATDRGPDEVRRLAAAFNAMTRSLRSYIARVSQQQAAAAIGEFAAALAHEVRNPLTAVRLDLERAQERTDDAAARDLVSRALQQIERLDSTVAGVLRIARSGSLEIRPLDLREPVACAARAAAPMFQERRAQLNVVLPDVALNISGNAAAMEQMLLNLLLNAAASLPPDGGDVQLTAEATPDSIRVTVRDNGRGMTDDELARACEPFFSTRDEGTGLGLTIVQRMAQAHGAAFDITSAPGRGTSVTLTFPRLPAG